MGLSLFVFKTMYWILMPKQCIKSNWNKFCSSFTPMHFYSLAATCFFTFELLGQLAMLDSDAHFVDGWLCMHAKVMRDTRRAAGLFSLGQGPSASKETVAWGWPFFVSPTQLHLQAGTYVNLSRLIAGKLKTTVDTDEPLQLCSATKLNKGQWGHTWQASWLHKISCVVFGVSVCAWGLNTEQERSFPGLMLLNSGQRD